MSDTKPQVTLKDLDIGARFSFNGKDTVNRITDVGTRTAVYIKLDKGEDTSWYDGPPYAVVEHVLDECDLARIDFIEVEGVNFDLQTPTKSEDPS